MPDLFTASDEYAYRFEGAAGDYFLGVQKEAVLTLVGKHKCGRKLLDVGGGHAQLAPVFIASGYQVDEYGSVEEAHKRLKHQIGASGNIKYISGDLLHMQISDQSYDLVVSVRLISHIEDWPYLISELCRVANKTVIIDYPSVASLNVLTPLLFRWKKKIEGNTRAYITFHEVELIREFEKNGFHVTGRYAQFFLPMVVHRLLKGAAWLQYAEKLFRMTGITRLFGSPVIIRFDRYTYHSDSQ